MNDMTKVKNLTFISSYDIASHDYCNRIIAKFEEIQAVLYFPVKLLLPIVIDPEATVSDGLWLIDDNGRIVLTLSSASDPYVSFPKYNVLPSNLNIL